VRACFQKQRSDEGFCEKWALSGHVTPKLVFCYCWTKLHAI